MLGEEHSLEDLIASTQRGVLCTRFWYIRLLDAQKLLLTGLTRDGNFLIEDGRIVAPALNFRFNESPVAVLANPVTLIALAMVVSERRCLVDDYPGWDCMAVAVATIESIWMQVARISS